MFTRSFSITAFLAVLVFSSSSAKAMDGEGTLVSQGVERSFVYHAPGDSIAEGLPLVLVFHGVGGSGQFIKDVSGFDAVADANDLIVVYPDATVIGGAPQWNAYVDEVSGHAGLNDMEATDDLVFVDELIEWFCINHGIDAQRIYATGHSYGGYMAYRLAVQRPDVIAAVAPVSADLWGDEEYLTSYFLQDYSSIPIMHIHGDADAVVPYPDPTHDPFADVRPLSVFALANCGSTSYESSMITANVHRLSFCDGVEPEGPRVEMIRLEDQGHQWPAVDGFDVAAEIWDFLSAHMIDNTSFTCARTGISSHDAPVEEVSVHPNPANGMIQFSRSVQTGSTILVRDLSGRIVKEVPINNSTLYVADLPAGIYLLEITERDGSKLVSRFIRE